MNQGTKAEVTAVGSAQGIVPVGSPEGQRMQHLLRTACLRKLGEASAEEQPGKCHQGVFVHPDSVSHPKGEIRGKLPWEIRRHFLRLLLASLFSL